MSDNFLSRWSRLKSEAKAETPPTPPQPAEQEASAVPDEQGEGIPQLPPPDLPPIDSLTGESDFSPFLQAGVPDHLRRAALSRLWASDPLFTRPEVFDLHMEDYNAHPLGEAVKTAWRVGKGIVEDLAEPGIPASFTDAPEKSHTKTKNEEDDTSAS